ncbi:hypothetical protein N7475_006786 [Penicillium sp. IBT 31633x]|nr:hypothetical protein N7475_006786 [Penicillium sp. IBT 31633x]
MFSSLCASTNRGPTRSGVRGRPAKNKKKCASSVNRTRASSMATTNSTTRPMMLKNQAIQNGDSSVVFAGLGFGL